VPEHAAIASLIDRIVAGACIPARAARDDLRQELWTHFEEADMSSASVAYAIRRFGDEAIVTDSLRRVYRWEYLALYVAKIVASVIASFAVALLIVAVVNLRVEVETEVWRLAPGFSRAAGASLAIVLGLIAAWEGVRRPFSASRALAAIAGYAAACGLVERFVAHSVSAFAVAAVFVALGCACSRLPSRPMRWLLTCAVFAGIEYGVHAAVNVGLTPGRAVIGGAILAAVWTSTLCILRLADRAFVHLFDAA
jgi:hypothetical protein